MIITALTLTLSLSAGAARADLRDVLAVSKNICRGYFELLDPVSGLRELRARARAEHNRDVFRFEDQLVDDSTHPGIRPGHPDEAFLAEYARASGLSFRVLVNRRRLYVTDEGLLHAPRGTGVLFDPATGMVESVFPPGAR